MIVTNKVYCYNYDLVRVDSHCHNIMERSSTLDVLIILYLIGDEWLGMLKWIAYQYQLILYFKVLHHPIEGALEFHGNLDLRWFGYL